MIRIVSAIWGILLLVMCGLLLARPAEGGAYWLESTVNASSNTAQRCTVYFDEHNRPQAPHCVLLQGKPKAGADWQLSPDGAWRATINPANEIIRWRTNSPQHETILAGLPMDLTGRFDWSQEGIIFSGRWCADTATRLYHIAPQDVFAGIIGDDAENLCEQSPADFGLYRVTPPIGDSHFPRWWGERVVFMQTHNGTPPRLFVTDLEGDNIQPLIPIQQDIFNPSVQGDYIHYGQSSAVCPLYCQHLYRYDIQREQVETVSIALVLGARPFAAAPRGATLAGWGQLENADSGLYLLHPQRDPQLIISGDPSRGEVTWSPLVSMDFDGILPLALSVSLLAVGVFRRRGQ